MRIYYNSIKKTETYYKLLEECKETFDSIKEEIGEDLDDEQMNKFRKFENLPDQVKVFLYAHNVYGRAIAKDLLGLPYNNFSIWYERHEELKPFKTNYKKYSNKLIKNQ